MFAGEVRQHRAVQMISMALAVSSPSLAYGSRWPGFAGRNALLPLMPAHSNNQSNLGGSSAVQSRRPRNPHLRGAPLIQSAGNAPTHVFDEELCLDIRRRVGCRLL